MKKINIDSKQVLSVGVALGTVLLSVLKFKDDANKEAAKKEEIINDVMERLASKDE